MAYPTKIATCCHCGTKAALTLNSKQHVLSCATCGAPLRDLKQMPKAAPVPQPAVSHAPALRSFAKAPSKPEKVSRKPKKAKKSKKRKGWFGTRFKDVAEDLFDVVEDIFD